MAALTFQEHPILATIVKSFTLHEDISAGTKVKFERGDDELSVVVPRGKVWDIQVTILVHETDA